MGMAAAGGFFKALLQFIKWAKIVGPHVIDWLNQIRPQVREWWHGKKIAIIGPTAVGKNSFYLRLQGLPIPRKHINTKALEDVPKFKFRRVLPDGRKFEIKVNRSRNVGGEKEQRDRFWLDACKEADVIFYMLSLKDLREGAYKDGNRVSEDLSWLGDQLGHMNGSPKVHFLINKVDVDLKVADDYDCFVEELKPLLGEFENAAKRALGPYSVRITGISPTSMSNDRIFNNSFTLVLESVYEATHRKHR